MRSWWARWVGWWGAGLLMRGCRCFCRGLGGLSLIRPMRSLGGGISYVLLLLGMLLRRLHCRGVMMGLRRTLLRWGLRFGLLRSDGAGGGEVSLRVGVTREA